MTVLVRVSFGPGGRLALVAFGVASSLGEVVGGPILVTIGWSGFGSPHVISRDCSIEGVVGLLINNRMLGIQCPRA